ncbi:MAG: M28 family peptidase [Bacteroidia bacterium]
MKNKLLIGGLFSVFMFSACGPSGDDKSQPEVKTPEPVVKLVNPNRPAFNADTAYKITASQVAFGPRVPNTEAHRKCANYLIEKLKEYGAEVIEQRTKVTAYTGEVLDIVNIVGRIQPELKKRIMLCGHWDTRPQSDQDEYNPKARFDGAVDGAASAGILLEIARQMKSKPADVGVDIVLFDAEDFGNPSMANTYCLGSQYFATHPPVKDFNPSYGILLDMVAASGAQFHREAYSMQYAPTVMTRVWSIAAELGHGNYFRNELSGAITDDHFYINTMMNIPTIDIIHHDPNTRTGFGSYWHTQDDNMQAVDKTTLQVVGETLIAVIYSE